MIELLLWLKLLLVIFPISLLGVLLVKRYSSISRLKLLLPVGIIIGFSFFIFLLNLIFYFQVGQSGILLTLIIVLIIDLLMLRSLKLSRLGLSFQGNSLFFWLISLIGWGTFLFWKVSHPLLGGDIGIYYSISSFFSKGNFPPVAPWQPDVPLSYHIGVFELLGALQSLTGFSFEFLHLFLAFLFILCSVQIAMWIFKFKLTLKSFLLSNLIVIVMFLSFGFLQIALPLTNFEIPNSFNQFILWSRELPTARESIELYGVPTNMDALIYVLFHSAGFSLLLAIVALLLYPSEKRPLLSWILILTSCAILALINESMFIALFPAVLVSIFLWQLYFSRLIPAKDQNVLADILVIKKFIFYYKIKKVKKQLLKVYGKIGLISVVTILVVLFQGGVISGNLNFSNSSKIASSVVIFPKKTDIKSDFMAYHLNSMKTKIHPIIENWKPFLWISLGMDVMFIFAVIFVFFHKSSFQQRLLFLIFFLISIFSLISYNFIVPKYILANSNRMLVIAFQFLAILTIFSLFWLINLFFKKRVTLVLLVLLLIVLILPTVIPPITEFSKTRFGENRLRPKPQERSLSASWAKDNLTYHDRIAILDSRTPHISGSTKFMIESGISAPVFAGGFKSYSIEAGPEYLDIALTLSPKAIEQLKINYLLIDSAYLPKLPHLRQEQINNNNFFELVRQSFKEDGSWEKIYQIKKQYITKGQELPGTLSELNNTAPRNGSFYIDNEQNFHPNFLRRAVIFTLRDRDLNFVVGSGVYQHTEVPINFHDYRDGNRYKYYILANTTDPNSLCQCQTKLLWTSYDHLFSLWENLDF